MKLKRRKVDGSIERRIMIGMIVSTNYLRDVADTFSLKHLVNPFARTIARWCLDYYKKYKKAPKKHIQDIFRLQKKKIHSPEEAEIISDFLSTLSEEYVHAKKFNADYLRDQTVAYIKERKLKTLSDGVEAAISMGDVQSAEQLINEFHSQPDNTVRYINPLTDANAVCDAFETSSSPIVSFSGALGEMINQFLVRDSLVALMGSEKRGKSWWLEEIVFRSLRSRCNTVLFQVGDMSEKQVIIRHHIRMVGRSNRERYCRELLIPVLDCLKNQNGTCKNRHCPRGKPLFKMEGGERPEFHEMRFLWKKESHSHTPCTWCLKRKPYKYRGSIWYKKRPQVEPLTWREGLKSGRSFFESRMEGRGYRLMTFPNKGISVWEIRKILDVWKEREGFIPDVIVIDYADNLAPEPEDQRKEFRHQQNGIWSAMSALRLERHCLLVTATQANAKSYEARTLRLRNFSEDKRKYAHTTAMFSLNQEDEEKLAGIMRMGLLLAREGSFSSADEVCVLQNLETGRPCLASFKM